MKTTNQPRPLAVSLNWIESLNGQGRLSVLVDTRIGSSLYGYCLKAGKESTLIGFRNDSASSGKDSWTIMSYYSARNWLSNVSSSRDAMMKAIDQPAPVAAPVPAMPSRIDRVTAYRRLFGAGLKEAIDAVDNDRDHLPPPAPVQPWPMAEPSTTNDKGNDMPSSVAGANAIVGLIEEAIAKAMDLDDLKAMAAQQLRNAVEGLIAPTVFTVKQSPDAPAVAIGTCHKNFPDLLEYCQATGIDGNRLNILLVGPAGTSKSYSAKQVAKALAMPFYPCSAISDEYKLFGFRDANGNVVRTAFREVWEHGGVFLFDELSGSDENAFLSFNGTLANGIAPFPDGAIERHKDCIIIAGDNVLGGATAEFNARNKMDDASLDRFIVLDWPIDTTLERVIGCNDSWVDMVQAMRKAVMDLNIRGAMITPRATLNGAALIRRGVSPYKAACATMRKGMDDANWSKVCSRVGLTQE